MIRLRRLLIYQYSDLRKRIRGSPFNQIVVQTGGGQKEFYFILGGHF